jgi:hypothetical protein
MCLLIHVVMFCHSLTGAVTLSPSGVAPVCLSGDQLELTCTITGELLQWRFSVVRGNDTTATKITRTITSISSTRSPLTVNSMVFNFSRISAHDRMPVMSRLVISPVSNSLNGTVMNCEDVDTREESSTTIIVGERGALQGMNYFCHSQGTTVIEKYRHILIIHLGNH